MLWLTTAEDNSKGCYGERLHKQHQTTSTTHEPHQNDLLHEHVFLDLHEDFENTAVFAGVRVVPFGVGLEERIDPFKALPAPEPQDRWKLEAGLATELQLRNVGEKAADGGEATLVGEPVGRRMWHPLLFHSDPPSGDCPSPCHSGFGATSLTVVCPWAQWAVCFHRSEGSEREISEGLAKNMGGIENEWDDTHILPVFMGRDGRRHRRMEYCAFYYEEIHSTTGRWKVRGT